MACDFEATRLAATCLTALSITSLKAVNIYLLCQWANYGSPSNLVNSWVDNIEGEGETVSAGTVSAVDEFIAGIAADGLLPLIYMLCPLVPDNLTAALTPLIQVPGRPIPLTNHNFVGVGTDLSVNGLTGDGATKYIDTGIVPSTDTVENDIGFSLIVSINPNNTDCNDMGCLTGTTDVLQLVVSSYGAGAPNGNVQWDAYYGPAGAARLEGANFGWVGWLSGTQHPVNGMTVWGAKTAVPMTAVLTGAVHSGSRPTHSIHIWGININGVASAFSNKTFSFVAVHKGFNIAQETALFARANALRVALGGGNV